jgi:esterase
MLPVVPARLHRELIGDPATPCMLLTHGIYGSGGNWRAIARKVVDARPDWSVALVDLRNHGRSESGEPPHTLAACAADVAALLDELPAVAALGGHSFGGKVMLAARASAPARIRQTWMFDSSPSARVPEPSVMAVLDVLDGVPRSFEAREDFITAVVAAGQPQAIAQWLAMNVVAEDDRYVLRLDPAAIRQMLADYFAQDLWAVAFDASCPGTLELVIAERSTTLDASDRERLAAPPTHVHVHRVDAGHWLHVEAPANVVELLVSRLPTALR